MNTLRILLRLLFGKRLPTTEGEIQTPGVEHPVTIRRDSFGIPYISAQTDEDAWYGLGFCQGQDRAFQIEMLVRISRGTISELIGESTLAIDQLSRRIGFHRYARGMAEILPPDVKAILESFTRGVNDGIHLGLPKLPHEYALLRSEPNSKEIVDILAALNYVSFGLSTWSTKLMRMKLAQDDGPEALQALNSQYADWMPVTKPVASPAGPEVDRLAEDLVHLMSAVGTQGLSNNWAINASKSETRRPLLANDPHLAPSVPAPWYLAHIRTPEWSLAGACFAGSPVFAAGHNQTSAWGVTAGLADNLDLYIEQLSEDQRSVRYGDEMVACEVIEEKIPIKGQSPLEDEIIITPRGPVISDQFADTSQVLSMRAIWMEPKPLVGLFAIYKTSSFKEFRQAFDQWPLTSLNMIYADTADTIGWQLIGAVPRRKGSWAITPMPGWDSTIGWEPEPIPFDEMPFLRNPSPGFLATANAKPTRDDGGPYLGSDWSEGYRLASITRLLEDDGPWSLRKFKEMQMNTHSLVWDDIKDSLLNTPVEHEDARRAIQIMENWDGNLWADSSAGAVYQVFVSELLKKMLQVKAPKTKAWVEGKLLNPMIPRVYLPGPNMTDITRMLQTKPAGWFIEGWNKAIEASLIKAIDFLEEHFSADASDWSWGELHALTLLHPLAEHPLMKKIFNLGPVPVGGDSFTISHTGRNMHDPTANPTVIANLRMVLDVGNWEDNGFILAGGQSGNPFSRHYDDQFKLWLKGETTPITWSEDAIRKATRSVLRIQPGEE